MKKAILLLAICLTLGFLNAQQRYHFRADAPQGFSIESSAADGLKLHYSIDEISITDIDNGEAKGQEIVMKGSFGSFAEGLPNLPFENQYIAVPKGAKVSIEVKEKGCKTFTDIDLLPAAPLQGNAAERMPKLHKDMSVFGKDADYPSENVAIAQATQIRGLDVVLLNVTPFRYNPVRKTLEVIYDMDIEVHFEGGSGQFGEARYRNPEWDGILRDLVINGDMLPEAHYYDLLNEAVKNREEGCEYLIISPDDDNIAALADTLRQFRTKQGILTKVVTTSECGGNDANAIKSYIQNAYEHWTIPPAAVMLFSGVDTLFATSSYYAATWGIPGFGLVFRGYDNGIYLSDYHYSSDNPYADMNGDSIPDLALSRLPACTLEEYRTQVNKLIQYETDPPTRPEYYDQPLVTSSYENNKWFLITSQSVSGFYRNKLGRHPKNFYMIYAQSDPVYPDTAWSTGYNTDVVVDYFGPHGQNYIAQRPDTLHDWRNPMDVSYFKDALNQSSFLTMYRDHSSFDLWCSPWMYSNEIRDLKNTEPTFVLSVGCDAALYSKAIYYESNNYNIYYGEDPMIYEFCKADVGGVGGVGAVTVTHSHFNDILTWGFIDNIWPSFMPDMGTMTQPEFTRPSYALIAGKLFLNQHAFMPNWWPLRITTTQNVFHYLGDTYLNLFTEVPRPIAIEVDSYLTNPSQLTFKAEQGTVVCLTHGDEIFSVVQATGEPQTITFPQLSIGEHLFITATKQNRHRFEKDVTIILPDQPYVYIDDFRINSHDNNGQFDAGELTDIDITLRNYNNIVSDHGTVTLTCDSPYVEITQNTASYPAINPETSIKIKKAFSVKIAEDAPDQHVVRFKIQFDENENTHADFFNMTLNAPILTIHPEYRLQTMDGEPSTHIIPAGTTKLTYRITNEGHSYSSPSQACITIKAPFVHVDEPRVIVDAIAPSSEQEIDFLLRSDDEPRGAWIQTSFELQTEDNHLQIEPLFQYGGFIENFESDTLNPKFNWSNYGGHPWTYSDEDAYEGQRCFVTTGNSTEGSFGTLQAKFRGNKYQTHDSKLSFRYKTSGQDMLCFQTSYNSGLVANNEWSYSEWTITQNEKTYYWYPSMPQDLEEHTYMIKIDDICFPPQHRIIAHAGENLTYCGDSGIELAGAYAYDYNTLHWTTDGDGYFEQDTLVNPIYYPGTEDLNRGMAMLTLNAINNTDTVISTLTLYFKENIAIGNIIGDSLVNIYAQPLSHYSVLAQDGINYRWQLEPANAGWLYANGNEVDVLWDNRENIPASTLSVTTDNGCETTPSTISIQMVGYSTPEWHSLSIKLFPNPTEGKVNLVCEEALFGKVQLEVFNMTGERIICHPTSNLMKGEQITIDLSRFASGLYLIKLSTSQGNYLQKVSLR